MNSELGGEARIINYKLSTVLDIIKINSVSSLSKSPAANNWKYIPKVSNFNSI